MGKKAVEKAGLKDLLSGPGPFTVFSPREDADNWPDLDAATKEELEPLIKYHVLKGTTLSTDLKDGPQTVTMESGKELVITKDSDSVTVGGAKVVFANYGVTNGVVHTIEKVLTPPAGA